MKKVVKNTIRHGEIRGVASWGSWRWSIVPHSHHSEGNRGEERGIHAPWKLRGELKSINRQEQLTIRTRSYLAGRSNFMILMYTARFLSKNTIALENYHLEMRRRLVYICQKAHSIFDADHYIGPTRRSLHVFIYFGLDTRACRDEF